MHRQKTIAKWLAVILSLTIAVACYIALSAITDGKSNDNVAGANDNEYPQNQTPQPPSPVYSVLPRKCEIIGDKNIAHFGGEAEEKMLDAFVFANKNVMVVSCDSKQYDVSETGIYLAIFDKTSLEKVVKITDKSGSCLSRCQTRNGLAIFVRSREKPTSYYSMRNLKSIVKTQSMNSTRYIQIISTAQSKRSA